MVIYAIRAVFVLAVLGIALSYALTPQVLSQKSDPITGQAGGLTPLTKVTLVVLIPVVLAVVLMVGDAAIHNKSLTSISGLFFGLVAGIVLAYILGMVVDLAAGVFMPSDVDVGQSAPAAADRSGGGGRSEARLATQPAGQAVGETGELAAAAREMAAAARELAAASSAKAAAGPGGSRSALVAMIKLLVGAFTIYLCVSFVLQTKDDFRFIIPYVEFARESKGKRPMILDTSTIIDGRIADVADTRVIDSEMIVPRFVLEEIQGIADSSDKLKRNRGRRGLDILNRLQADEKLDIRLLDARTPGVEDASGVDQKLVALAEHLGGRLVTNDYNLNKIAKLRGVEVVNINDLANALKPVLLPGERVTVKMIKPGEEMGQGIGYLDDGTMVVAEQGREHIGQEMTITVTSVLQTSAGRMIFGRPESAAPPGRRT